MEKAGLISKSVRAVAAVALLVVFVFPLNLTWPTDGLLSKVPDPPTSDWEIEDASDVVDGAVCAVIYGASKQQYDAYLQRCEQYGFNKNVRVGETIGGLVELDCALSYWASLEDGEGHLLLVDYGANKTMSVTIMPLSEDM